MAEVHRISGEKVEDEKALVNEELVAVLDEMRQLALDGRLTFVALVAKCDSQIWTRVKGHSAGKYWEALGALEVLKFDMIEGAPSEPD